MTRSFVFVLVLIAMIACNQEEKKTFSDPLRLIKNDSVQNVAKKDSVKNSLSPNTDTFTFHLTMDTANMHIPVTINISSGNKLFAALSSADKNANIRISQIEFPDSTFNGPFGRTLHYKIKDTGNYKIIVGEDMMAGDRWKGDFTLKTWVK